MKIYLDFDGTVVEHDYPRIGELNPMAIEVITKLKNAGHEIILNTYRANLNKKLLLDSAKYLNERVFTEGSGIKMVDSKINPEPFDWERILSEEVLFIDDIAQSIPLRPQKKVRGSMVDWVELDYQLLDNGLYN